jgi:hypothetical protein
MDILSLHSGSSHICYPRKTVKVSLMTSNFTEGAGRDVTLSTRCLAHFASAGASSGPRTPRI